ncbi:TorD/DmsD family molecular chaperone [Desulfosediminicola ganghwensis]|uniref:TorD/DmsD family molecular chaperone n=1 Tax=Desulfosediminicola ganghwensis TaxID=2569540 RepID=UPI0010ABF19E|nr:molecular chaperone TorD family protein [Desulfosediminicola ganghwensis]
MNRTIACKKAAALRNFFSAIHSEHLRSATDQISELFEIDFEEPTDWVEVEYDFNRLFVGPGTVPAPPYASAYLDEPTLMGAPSLEVRQFYVRLGVAVPDQGSTPDDFLAFELDAVSVLDAAKFHGDLELEQHIDEFITTHMCGWIPRFIDAVESQENVSSPVSTAIMALSSWLKNDCPAFRAPNK